MTKIKNVDKGRLNKEGALQYSTFSHESFSCVGCIFNFRGEAGARADTKRRLRIGRPPTISTPIRVINRQPISWNWGILISITTRC